MNAFVNEGSTYGEGVMAVHLVCWSMVVGFLVRYSVSW
jgi:hypothetical protein